MHRKPAFSLAYAHVAFRPTMRQTFSVPEGIPDTMRSVLARLDGLRSLSERDAAPSDASRRARA